MSEPVQPESQGKSTIIVMVTTLFSRVFGFVRMVVVSAIFGASGSADVLNGVFSIPNNLRKLMAEGALSSAFIPLLSKEIIHDPTLKKAHQFSKVIWTFQIMVLLPFTVLAILFATPITSWLTPFPEVEKAKLAASLFQWLIPYLLLVSLSAILMGIQNAHKRFFVPSVTPVLFSISVIASLLLFYFFYPAIGIFSIVPGILLGGAIQILFQMPSLKKLGYSFSLSFDFKSENFRLYIKKWIPAISTSLVFLLSQQISMALAASLSDGSTSALNNAITFWQLPQGIFSAALVTVLFPKMSREAVLDKSLLAETLSNGLKMQALLLIPSSFFLIILGPEIVAIALQRGAFTIEDTMRSAGVLQSLSYGLFSAGAFSFLQRYFYVKGKFKTPFLIAIIGATVDLIFSVIFMNTSLGVQALSWGNTIDFTIGFLSLFSIAFIDLPKKKIIELALFIVKILISLVPSATFLIASGLFLGDWWKAGMSFKSFGILCGVVIVSTMLILITLRILGINFFRYMGKRK